MISCVVEYVIDETKVAQFERYAGRWIATVTRLGGVHHGYFLPCEGASDRAIAIFSFDNLAAYEAYRNEAVTDPECLKILADEQENRSVRRYRRSFFRPVLPDAAKIHLSDERSARAGGPH